MTFETICADAFTAQLEAQLIAEIHTFAGIPRTVDADPCRDILAAEHVENRLRDLHRRIDAID